MKNIRRDIRTIQFYALNSCLSGCKFTAEKNIDSYIESLNEMLDNEYDTTHLLIRKNGIETTNSEFLSTHCQLTDEDKSKIFYNLSSGEFTTIENDIYTLPYDCLFSALALSKYTRDKKVSRDAICDITDRITNHLRDYSFIIIEKLIK